MKSRSYQSSFNAGVVAEALEGQIQLPVYKNGARQIDNCFVRPQGGLKRRPGTRYIATYDDVTYQVEPFLFSESQRYLVIFSNGELTIVDAVAEAEVFTLSGMDWTEAMIGYLSVVQEGDTMFVAHEELKTKVLKRTGAATFTVSDFAFEATLSGTNQPPKQPYWKYLRPEVTMQIDFVDYGDGDTVFDLARGYETGTIVTLTCSESFFTADHVGSYIQIDTASGDGTLEITDVTSETVAEAVLRTEKLCLKLAPDAVRLQEGDTDAWILMPYHNFEVGTDFYMSGAALPDSALVGDVGIEPVKGEKEVLEIRDNEFRYHAIDSPLPSQTLWVGGSTLKIWAASMRTRGWKEPLLSDRRGWPAAVGFHDSRLVLAGSQSIPHVVMMSQTGAYFNFDTGTGLDDEAIVQTLPPEYGVPKILAVVSYTHLLIFTDTGEFVAPGSENKRLSPGTVAFKRKTPYGTMSGIRPQAFDGSVIYASANTSNIREFTLDGASEIAYASNGLDWISQLVSDPVDLEVLAGGFTDQPMMAFVVNGDGTIAILSFIREQKFAAWSRWTTEGEFVKVCAVGNKLFAMVRRELADGVESISLEVFDVDAVLDCQAEWSGAVATTIGPFAHFDDIDVYLTTPDYRPLGTVHVNGSNMIVGVTPLTAAIVGFNFRSEGATLPAELQVADGPTKGMRRRVSCVRASYKNTYALAIRGSQMQSLTGLGLLSPPEPQSGSREWWFLGWDREGSVRFSVDWPVPFELNSLNLDVEF